MLPSQWSFLGKPHGHHTFADFDIASIQPDLSQNDNANCYKNTRMILTVDQRLKIAREATRLLNLQVRHKEKGQVMITVCLLLHISHPHKVAWCFVRGKNYEDSLGFNFLLACLLSFANAQLRVLICIPTLVAAEDTPKEVDTEAKEDQDEDQEKKRATA